MTSIDFAATPPGRRTADEQHKLEGAIRDLFDRQISFNLHLGTVDPRVDYLSPGLGKSFMVAARLSRMGARLAATRVELHNETGLLIATGSAAYSVS